MGCHVGSKGVLTSTAELEWSSMAAAHSKIIAVCRVEPGLCRMHAHVFTEYRKLSLWTVGSSSLKQYVAFKQYEYTEAASGRCS